VGADRRDHPTIIKVETRSCTHAKISTSGMPDPAHVPLLCVCRSCGTTARKGTATGYQVSSTSRGRRAPGSPTISRPGP
jgi:hypothetical protein